jgi:hypothetical protein
MRHTISYTGRRPADYVSRPASPGRTDANVLVDHISWSSDLHMVCRQYMLPNLVDIPADVAIFATIVSVVAVNGSVDEELLQPEDGLPTLSASMLVVFGDVQTTGETA